METISNGIKTEVTTDTHVYVNPKNFKESDYPIICCVDDLRSLTGWAIKAHGNGNYNHTIILNRPGFCVSQDFGGFKEKSIDKYLIDGVMLKFWIIKDLTPDEKLSIFTAINRRLNLPWWRHGYDFLGVFVGQFLHLKFIQNPFQEFCSEEVNDDYLMQIPRISQMLIKKPNPSEINAELVMFSEFSMCLGYWWFD